MNYEDNVNAIAEKLMLIQVLIKIIRIHSYQHLLEASTSTVLHLSIAFLQATFIQATFLQASDNILIFKKSKLVLPFTLSVLFLTFWPL